MRIWLACLVSLSLVATACGGGDDDGGTADASVNTPDGATNTPDADPNAPDADPNAPDADPSAPDADPSAPDAATGCTNGLTMCGGQCVDVSSNDSYCGNCTTSCTLGESCVLGNCVTGVGDLVLSEVHAHEPSFFELYNGGSAAIDLSGYQIQWMVDGITSGADVLPSYTLGAGEFVTLREGNGTSGNGVIYLGDDIDWVNHIGVRLLAPGGLGIDFVRTGASTVPPGTSDTWTGGNATNPSPVIDQSLVRNVYTADTNTAADWSMINRGSPGDYCPAPGRCGAACYDFASDRDNCGGCGVQCSGSQLCIDSQCQTGYVGPWITEYRRSGRPGVEIHNPTPNSINMTNYRLDVTGGASTLSYTFPSFTLQPGQFVFVFMGDGVPDGSTLYTGPSAAFGPNVAISLFDDGTTALDFVRFGTSAEPAPSGVSWFGANITAPLMGPDSSARRNIETFDTDSAADWNVSSPSTPAFTCYPGLQACSGVCYDTQVNDAHCGSCTNACGAHERCNAGVCTSSGAVKIAELRNYSTEYIELHNGTDTAVDLNNWQLEWVADGGVGNYTITNLTIQPGASIIFYDNPGTSTSTTIYMGSPIYWTDYIAVSIKDSNGNGVDFVRTGTSTTTPPTGTSWTGANVPNPASGSSTAGAITRNVFAADTDTAADWAVSDDSPARLCRLTTQTVCGSTCVDTDTNINHCGTCGNVCGPGSRCFGGECVVNGAIRFVQVSGTDGIQSGRIEVFENVRWHNVGWDGTWGNTDATVACKELGYPTGTGNTSSYSYCTGCGRFYNVQCTGDEPRLVDCPHSTSSSLTSGYRAFCSIP